LGNRQNVIINEDLTLPSGNAQLCIGPRWCIRAEGENLVFRDMKAPDDKRYAMFNNSYVDINNVDTNDIYTKLNNKIDSGNAITLKSAKRGVQERRLQRADNDTALFANNNRGDWETMFIEKNDKW
jgi:hypothetical protein